MHPSAGENDEHRWVGALTVPVSHTGVGIGRRRAGPAVTPGATMLLQVGTVGSSGTEEP